MTSPSDSIAGRYDLHERLMLTDIGEVWRAVDQQNGQNVSVRLVDERLAADPDFAAHFRREAQSAAALNHPNLVRVLDYGRSGDRYYLVEELIDGPDLKHVLEVRAPLPVDQALAITAQAAAGVAAAHSTGIVHRDVRPSAIRLRSDGAVKVGDMALAHAASGGDIADASGAISAAGYMSPEQARGGELSPASDVYTLGVLLFAMLTGRLPFEAATPSDAAMRQTNEDPPSPRLLQPDLPEEVDALVLRALARQPADRFPDAGALRAAVFRLPQFDPGTSLMPLAALRPPRPVAVAPSPPPPPLDVTTVTPMDDHQPVDPVTTIVDLDRRGPRRAELLTMAAFIAVGLLLGVGAVFAVLSLARPSAGTGTSAATATPQTVIVPSVLGRSLADARRIASEQGLTVTSEERPDAGATAGTVIDQEPLAGRTARNGTALRLVVAATPPAGIVPNVQGLTVDEARNALSRVGMSVGWTQERASLPEHRGQVVAQNPPPGVSAPPSTSVELFLGDGRPVPETATPMPTPSPVASPTPIVVTATPQRTPTPAPTAVPTHPAAATATPRPIPPTPVTPTPPPAVATPMPPPAAPTATPVAPPSTTPGPAAPTATPRLPVPTTPPAASATAVPRP